MIYQIVPNLYLSNLLAARNTQGIQSNNIDIVCRLSEDENTSIYSDKVQFHNYVLEDNIMYGHELIEAFISINDTISSNPDKRVLIHCNEGKSRSVSIIMMYLMTNMKLSYNDAYKLIHSKKTDIHINAGFKNLLMEYERCISESQFNPRSESIKVLSNTQYYKYKDYKWRGYKWPCFFDYDSTIDRHIVWWYQVWL